MRRLLPVAALLLALASPSPAGAELERWTRVGPPAPVIGVLELDPSDPATLYGASYATLYRSRDRGGTWERLPGFPPDTCCVFTVEADPAVPGRVYALGASPIGSALLVSPDGGETWRGLERPDLGVFAVVPARPSVLLAASYAEGLLRSVDGGTTWTPSSEGLGENACCIGWIAPSPASAATVYVLAGDGLYRSTDAGLSWELRTLPGEEGEFFASAKALDPADAGTLYLVDGLGNVFRSRDGGATWKAFGPPLTISLYGYVVALAVAATAPATVYVVTDTSVYRSTGGPGGWSRLDAPVPAGGLGALTADPADPERLYWVTSVGVLATDDGGVSWRPAGGGLPGLPTQAVAVGSDGRVYAAASWGGVGSTLDGISWAYGAGDGIEGQSVLSLATGSATGRVLAGTYEGRVLRSDDGGVTWVGATQGLPRGSVWGLAVDPATPGRVLAATELGVYRSGNGGERWRRSSRGLPNTGVRCLAPAPSSLAIVYAGLDRGGVWRSDNGGRSWRPAGLGRLTVLALAVDPSAPERVYAATRRAGAYRSEDGGRTWQRIAATRRTAALSVDVATPGTVLLATGAEVLRSRDAGRTWSPLVEGLPDEGGLPFDPEARAPRLVLALAGVPGGAYAATWSGVYSLRFAEDAS